MSVWSGENWNAKVVCEHRLASHFINSDLAAGGGQCRHLGDPSDLSAKPDLLF